jgi:hypothetical protein
MKRYMAAIVSAGLAPGKVLATVLMLNEIKAKCLTIPFTTDFGW